MDGLLKATVELRCLGGFVVTQQYGIGRETSDIDFLAVFAQSPEDYVEVLAGLGSKLHRKYRLYMQHVGIATPPSDYAQRLTSLLLLCLLPHGFSSRGNRCGVAQIPAAARLQS